MTRRGHDEGSIYQRKDGLWTSSISLGYGPNGKRRRKSYYGKTRREVADRLKAAMHDHGQGLPIDAKRQTVKQFLEHWLENAVKPTIRPSTFSNYSSHVRVHLVPALGHVQLGELTPQDIHTFLNDELTSGLSPHTTSDIYHVLRRALGQAVRWGLLARNVAALVDPPRFEKTEMRYLTTSEALSLLEAVKGERMEAFYSVAVALGLRRGEALGLRWEDVDFDAGVLYVRRSLQRIGKSLQFTEPKTATSRRQINLPKATVTALRAHRVRQLEGRVYVGSKWQDNDLVFCTGIGTPYEPNNIRRHFLRMLEQAGLQPMRVHDLRHTAASLMLAQGIPPKVISEILGHSRISITLDTYSHLMEPMRREAADKMDELLGGL